MSEISGDEGYVFHKCIVMHVGSWSVSYSPDFKTWYARPVGPSFDDLAAAIDIEPGAEIDRPFLRADQ